MAEYLLGIDNGGTTIKASVYDNHGYEIATSGEKTKLIIDKPGFIERDMDELWQSNCDVIRSVLKKGNVNPASIAGIAVTGHGNGLYPIDRYGSPVGNGILSADSRANSIVEQWYRDGIADEVAAISCQDIWAGQPVALLSWMRRFNTPAFEKTAWVLMCKDYIRYRLTGEIWAERTDYSGTNLVDPHTGGYSDRLLEIFGLLDCKSRLPVIKDSADYCGAISRTTAAQTGLLEGTPVYAGMFDIDANAIGMGITHCDMLAVIAGTWSINECISKYPVHADPPYRCTDYCMPGYWLITESSPTSASNLEWFITNILGKTRFEGSIYDYCENLVEKADPTKSNLLFLPFLYGSNVGPQASGGFLGLSGWHTMAEMVRAVFEGVVCSHRMHVDRLLLHYPNLTCYRISGGAARSHTWVQLFADMLDRPMELLENEEIGTLGAAMTAGVGCRMFASFEDAAKEMVRIKAIIEPRKVYKEIYERKYQDYRKAVKALQGYWGNQPSW